MFIIYHKPFAVPSHNKLEIFNELCILLVSFALPGMSSENQSTDARYNVGWYMIACVGLNIVVNLSLIFTSMFFEFKGKIRRLVNFIRRKIRGRKGNYKKVNMDNTWGSPPTK